MAEFSHIQWTDHTHNPWWGCARVSPACRFCYADTTAQRWKGSDTTLWRRNGERRMMSDAYWRQPLKWNRAAEAAGTPLKVFCASMADVFEDHPQVVEARERLWRLIEVTPWLRWQLLTKRPENVAAMAPWGDDWPASVWLGTSVENQRWADARVPILLDTPAKVRFLSAEPLLSMVNLRQHLATGLIHQVIIGGESGAKARSMEVSWVRDLLHQCSDLEVAAFVKQTGSVHGKANHYRAAKGGDIAEWPEDIRVREYPRVPEAVAAR